MSNGQDDPGQQGSFLPSLRETDFSGSSWITPATVQIIPALSGKPNQRSNSDKWTLANAAFGLLQFWNY